MRMFSLFRLSPLVFCFLVASKAFAWDSGGWTHPDIPNVYPSAIAACNAVIQKYQDGGYKNIRVEPGAADYLRVCKADYRNPAYPDSPYQSTNKGNVSLVAGSKCNEPKQINADGFCSEPDPCAQLAGESAAFFAKAPYGQSTLPGEYVCMNSCRAAWSGQCGANDLGESACWGVATFNGQPCQNQDSQTGPPPGSEDPNQPTCGEGYSWSGTTCVPTPDPDPEEPCEGEDCPPPTCEGDDCPEEPCEGEDCPTDPGEEGEDGDGEDSEEGGDDKDKTDPSMSGKDPDGKACDPAKDPNCTPCNPATDSTCPSAVSAVDDCSTPLNCKGDAVQCSMLRLQREQACQYKWDADVKGEVLAAVSGKDFELEKKSIPVATLFHEATAKSRWLPTACPRPESFTVMGRSYSLSFEPLCKFAAAMAPIIVAFASIFFALSVGKALKDN